MPVTPSLTKKGIHLLIEYREKVDKMISDWSLQKEVPPQYLAARNILQVFIDAANGIWPFIKNLLANKEKKLDKNFLILSQGKKVAISIIDSASLPLGELTIELLVELKNNTNLYIDAGTALDKIGPLLAAFIGEEIKIENTEQAFAFIQYHLITAMSEIKNEIHRYNNILIKKNNKNILLPPVPEKHPHQDISIESSKYIADEEMVFCKQHADKECRVQGEKNKKTRQIENLLLLLEQLNYPDFWQTWPLVIPQELLQIVSPPWEKLYMAVTMEQKYQLIKRITTDIFLCSNFTYKKQIKEKIKNLPNKIKSVKSHDGLFPDSVYEIRERYIILLRKNPGIFPVSFAINGLIQALENCRYQYQLDDIIESTVLLQKTLEISHAESKLVLKALLYEMLFSLKKPTIPLQETLRIPDSQRTQTLSCLNNLLSHCQHLSETLRVYHLAACALNKTNGNLKNKILAIIKENKIENLSFSSFDTIINNQIILLLQYILSHEKNNFFFFYSPTNQPYYIIGHPKQLATKLFNCKIPQHLIEVRDEIDNMQAVLTVNEHFYSEFKSLLKKIQKTLYSQLHQENITAAPIKRC